MTIGQEFLKEVDSELQLPSSREPAKHSAACRKFAQ
jgi:hypothetical protein